MSSVVMAGALALSACATTTSTGTTTGTTTTGTTAGTTTAVTASSAFTSSFWTRGSPSDLAIEAAALNNAELASVADPAIGGVTFLVGTDSDSALGYAAVNFGSAPGTTVTTGGATYDASYRVVQLSNVKKSGSTLTADTLIDSGLITLTADFDAGTLTGSSGDLDVAGLILVNDLNGAVSFRSVAGALDGEIGADGVLGAFHGSTGGTVYAGGFAGQDR
ncbi:hypothetical protein [Maritimibacter sp. UBA3975]|uniref:hypothetical protein n=1 Tax=Maritimibacter sp. UBA3975 TaxID=1946833 RepID=UPI0025B7FA48|nr:hypothetical protein [Maritimibacter sp. UBA3975]